MRSSLVAIQTAQPESLKSPSHSAILATSRRCFHVPNRPLWPHSGQQCTRERSLVAGYQEGHDCQAPEADRAGGSQESKSAVPAGTVLRSLFLRRAEYSLVRTHRASSRRAHDETHAEDCREASHGDRCSCV